MLFRLLLENPLVFLLVATALVLSISIHEFAHAWTAYKLGDSTAKLLGRVTLNPLAHLDPVGTLLIFFAGFGWGKPVPFDPFNLKNPKRDGALIALAGPFSNIILAVSLSLIFHLIPGLPIFVSSFVYMAVLYNLVLAIFNLIPVHPLDGFKVVNGLLPESLSYQWLQMAPYGIFILLFLIFTNITQLVIMPIINFFMIILGF